MWLTPTAGPRKAIRTSYPCGINGRQGERTGGRHVRSGCSTCKTRHVKCDEEKPACYQCRKTGRVCDGYNFSKSHVVMQASSVSGAIPIPKSTIARLDHGLPGSYQERRCFEIFECEMGNEIMQVFNSTHAYQLILQAGHTSAAIKHAVVALGSLGEPLAQNKVLVQTTDGLSTLAFSRMQYSKAVTQLQCILSGSQSEPLELILACCLLLVIFNFLCGDELVAQIHLKSGLDIIHRCYSPAVRDRMRLQADDAQTFQPLVYDLFRIFSIMDLHATIWLGLPSSYSPPLVPQAIMMAALPPAIDSTLDEISTRLNYQLVRAHSFRHSVTISGSSLNDYIAPCYVLAEKQRLLDDLQRWPSMLDHVLSSNKHPPTDLMARRVSLMRMNYHATLVELSIFLETSPPTETPTLSISSAFSQILIEAQYLLQPASPTNRAALLVAVGANAGELDARGISLFAFVAGAIQPLYFTAVKCNYRTTSETAVSMLEEVPWREGAWNSDNMARIARRCLHERFQPCM